MENPGSKDTWAWDDAEWWALRDLGKSRGKGWRRETSVAVAAGEQEQQPG